MLKIKRKAYCKKAFYGKRKKTGKVYRVGGYCVPSGSYKITIVGEARRGKRVLPLPLKAGALGISFKSPMETLKRKLTAQAKQYGEKVVGGRLRAIAVLNKRKNPALSEKASKLADFVYGSFAGKKLVGFPAGFRSKARQLKSII